MELIRINKNKCTLCYSCVRICPTKALTLKEGDENIMIHHNRCIGCGNCYVNCGYGAIEYNTQIDETLKIAGSKNKSVAIVDPAISAEFPDIKDYRNFVGMIKAIGFDYVNEISFGADIVAKKYKEYLEDFKGKYYISANCPPVVSYVEKFIPEIITSLVPVDSPLIATAKIIKEIHGDDVKIVAITPCIGQKEEAKQYNNLIDTVISFEELRKIFSKNAIRENTVEFSEFDPPLGFNGTLYPIATGILDAGEIEYKPVASKIINREGYDLFRKNIADFANINEIKHHLNVYFCRGCCTGPCVSDKTGYMRNHSLVVDFASRRNSIIDKSKWGEDISKYSKLDFSRKFKNKDQRIPDPPQSKINEVLKLLGKEFSENIGCQSCGYYNCSEFASDVAKGLMIPEMCMSFTLKNRQDFINKLKTTNKKLAETQKALEKSEAKIRQDHESVKESMSMLTALLEKLPSGVVLIDADMKVVQSNSKFVNLLGQDAKDINDIIPGLVNADIKTLLPHQVYNLFSYVIRTNEAIENKDLTLNEKLMNVSVFPIRKNKIVGVVFRDLFQPEIRKEEVVNRINDVIEKNLHMVQQIGFLLGEGASDTERMLNSIINSFETQNNKADSDTDDN